MKIQAIIAAAGIGQRLGSGQAKPFAILHGKPLVLYALEVFEKCLQIDSVIVAAHAEATEKMTGVIRAAGFKKSFMVVAGGKERRHSVKNALNHLDSDTELVLVHDGARPFINVRFIEAMIQAAIREDALIAAVPVKPTIKRADAVNKNVVETLDRSCLWDTQTPQIFKKDVLARAYEQADFSATDDASLVERLGITVRIFPGLEENIKVTTPMDLFIAEKLLERHG
ncbi:MAG: 2-C-methyl-D-erythritol 4-phosphate cytidylyltransferase [Candidatus Omnitrophota bacterium]